VSALKKDELERWLKRNNFETFVKIEKENDLTILVPVGVDWALLRSRLLFAGFEVTVLGSRLIVSGRDRV
jgi:hypothetical protein